MKAVLSMSISADLLKWYDQHHRKLPWRANPGEKPTPYHVWISEIMLQQTTVPTVIDYFNRFIQKWPSIKHLATASLDDVLHAWQGLGYYSRARNLHKCAQVIASDYGGEIPKEEKELIKLPGIGPYTAAAISAIAYDIPAPVVDGNIERILSRLYTLDTPPKQVKNKLTAYMNTLVPKKRPGDFVQSLMDLGSSVCTPNNPICVTCPIQPYCQAHSKNTVNKYPVKPEKKEKPTKHAYVFLLFNNENKVLLEKRPTKGLLGGMIGFPTSKWSTTEPCIKDLKSSTGKNLVITQNKIKHTFTHFHLFLTIVTGETKKHPSGFYAHPNEYVEFAIPTLMKKVWEKFKAAE